MKNYKFKINGNTYSVEIKNAEDDIIELELNGTPYKVELEREKKTTHQVKSITSVSADKPKIIDRPITNASAPAKGVSVKAPLPGTILDVFVNVGDEVKEGQKILLLEAMKMENEINADKDGVIKEVRVRKGDTIMEGDTLVVIG